MKMTPINKIFTIAMFLLGATLHLNAQALVDFNFLATEEIGFTSIDQENIVKLDDGNHIVLMSNYYEHFMRTENDTIFASGYKIEEDTCRNVSRTLILKLDENFDLIDYIELKFLRFSKLAVTNSRIFVSANFDDGCNLLYMDDNIYTLEDAQHGILEFDRDLNFIDFRQTESNTISHIIANDSLIYYIEELIDTDDPSESFTVYNGDTISTYEPDTTITLPFLTNIFVLVKYDYKNDTVLGYQRFGSVALDRVTEFSFDALGNPSVVGNTSGLQFYANDTTILYAIPSFASEEYYTISYDQDLNLKSAFTSKEMVGDRILSTYADSNAYYFGGICGDAEIVLEELDTTILNPPLEGNIRSEKAIWYKKNKNGNLLWFNLIDGVISASDINSILVQDDIHMIGRFIGPTVNLNNSTYNCDDQCFIYLKVDKLNGKILSHAKLGTTPTLGNGKNMKLITVNNKLITFKTPVRDVRPFLDYDFGMEDETIEYFITFDLDFLVSVNDIKEDEGVILYPNPILHNQVLNLQIEDHKYNTYTIYNSLGQIIKKDALRQNQIYMPNDRGLHYLLLESKESKSIHTIIIQ